MEWFTVGIQHCFSEGNTVQAQHKTRMKRTAENKESVDKA